MFLLVVILFIIKLYARGNAFKYIIQYICNTFTVPCEKSKTVSFASGRMENIGRMENAVVFPSRSKSPAKLIY